MYKITNMTNSMQQILFADNSAEAIYPMKSIELDTMDNIRQDENDRIKRFFRIEEIIIPTTDTVIVRKGKGIKKYSNQKEGGDE